MVASFLSFLSPQEETEDDLHEVGGQVQVRWAVCPRVAVAKGSGTEDSELSAVAWGLGDSKDFQALLVITVNGFGTMTRLWWSFLVCLYCLRKLPSHQHTCSPIPTPLPLVLWASSAP